MDKDYVVATTYGGKRAYARSIQPLVLTHEINEAMRFTHDGARRAVVDAEIRASWLEFHIRIPTLAKV